MSNVQILELAFLMLWSPPIFFLHVSCRVSFVDRKHSIAGDQSFAVSLMQCFQNGASRSECGGHQHRRPGAENL